jgi:hypothetical protein
MVGVGEVRVAVLRRRVAMHMGVFLARRQTQIRVIPPVSEYLSPP